MIRVTIWNEHAQEQMGERTFDFQKDWPEESIRHMAERAAEIRKVHEGGAIHDTLKNLAEESAKAAGKTRVLIETTIQAVDRGISIADDTVENMMEVIKGAEAATNKMKQISELLEKDVNNMEIINDSITKVSAVVDDNSATSEETAAVSEQQKAEVETMVSLISHFRI